jgi:hypothetical protein
MGFGNFLQTTWDKSAEATNATLEAIGDAALSGARVVEESASAAFSAAATVSQAFDIVAQMPHYVAAQILAAPTPTLLLMRSIAANLSDKFADVANVAAPYSTEARLASAIFSHASKVFMHESLKSTMVMCPKKREAIRNKLRETIKSENDLIETAKARNLACDPIVVRAREHVAVATKALISDDVYNDGPVVDIPGVHRMSDEEILALHLNPEEFNPIGSSFRSALYKSDGVTPTTYTLAFRGTDSFRDALTDAGQALGLETDAYNRAMLVAQQAKLAIQYKDPNSVFDLTGHSLGGGEVQAASCVTGAPGMTFNPAGLNSDTAPNCDLDALKGNMSHFHVAGEPLNTVNTSVAGIPKAIGASNELPAPANTSVLDLHRMPSVESALCQTGQGNLDRLNSLVGGPSGPPLPPP